MNVIKYFVFYLLAMFVTFAHGQTIITGVVRAHDGTIQESAIITARNPADSTIVGYAFTNAKGAYTLKTNAPSDSILLVLTGFNVKKVYKSVVNRNATIDWETTEESLVLREVQIKAQKQWGSRDTLNYLVSAYMKDHDVTIGDVLKSLPGITINDAGQISYQGVPISKFYIENMDVLQGRYNLATRGIKAEDVHTVQVMERHEHVKALQDQTPPEAAALNLKLKKEKKGIWSHTLFTSAGLDDKVRYRGSWQSMYFGKKRQHVLYGMGMNDGSGSNMLHSHYGGSGIAQDIMTGVANPGSSPMGNSIDNRNYGATTNNVVKQNDSVNFHVNASYGKDITNLSTYRHTTYLLPDENERLLVEDMNAHYNYNAVDAQVMYEKNKAKLYVKNTFDAKGIWNKADGWIDGTADGIDQSFYARTIGLHNNFSMVYRTKKNGGFKFNSDNSFRSTPQRLSLSPGVFCDFLNDSINYGQTSQTGRINRFASHNDFALVADIRRRHLTIVPTMSFGMEHINIESDINVDKVIRPYTHGDMVYTNVSANAGAQFQLVYSDFHIKANLPLAVTTTILGGESHNDNNRVKLFFSPSMSLFWRIKEYWTLEGNGGYGMSSTSWRMLYTAYVLSSYNNMQHYGGGIFDTESMSGRLKLNYRNIFNQVFCHAEISANRTHNDIVYGSYIDENSFSTTQMKYAPHHSTGYNVKGSIRKDIDWIELSMEMNGGYSRSNGVYLRQSVLTNSSSDSYSIGATISFRPFTRMTVNNNVSYSSSKSRNSLGYEGMNIRHFSNNFHIFFTIVKSKLFLDLDERHTSNTSFNGMRHFDMMNAGLRWKVKETEINFSVSNILNNRNYFDRYETDMVNTYTMYELTPRRFMVGTVFHFK